MCRNFFLTIALAIGLLFSMSEVKAVQENKKSEDSNPHSHIVFYYHRGLAGSIEPHGWDHLVRTYNSVTSPIKPLTRFKNKSVYDIGLRVCGERFRLSVYYQHLDRTCEAGFNFGESRVFEFSNNALSFSGGCNLFSLFHHHLEMDLNAAFRIGGDVILSAGYRYPDGFVSYGGETTLSGVFTGFNSMGASLGSLLKLRLVKGLAVELNYEYQFNNLVASSSFTDLSSYKALNPGSTLGAISFPADYTTYDPNNAGYYEELKSKHLGYNLTIGLAYGF